MDRRRASASRGAQDDCTVPNRRGDLRPPTPLPDGEVYSFVVLRRILVAGLPATGGAPGPADVRAAQNAAPSDRMDVRGGCRRLTVSAHRGAVDDPRQRPTSREAPPRYNSGGVRARARAWSVYDRDPGMRVRYVHPLVGTHHRLGARHTGRRLGPVPGAAPRGSSRRAPPAFRLLGAAGRSSLDPGGLSSRHNVPYRWGA